MSAGGAKGAYSNALTHSLYLWRHRAAKVVVVLHQMPARSQQCAFGEVWCLWPLWVTHYIIYTCSGRHCLFFCYVVVQAHVKAVNTVCRMVSLRLGLGCFYRSSSAPLIRPSQAFSVHAAGAVPLLSRYQSSASAWPFPVRLPRGLHTRAAASTHECKVTLNLLNAQIIA